MKHHLISCPIFAKELEAILTEISAKPAVHFMDYKIHTSAETMERELAEKIKLAQAEGAAIALLVGQECKALQPINQLADSCCGSLPAGHNCIEIILGRDRAKDLQDNRTTIMTPAWIRMIKKSIADGYWTVEDARINLGWYNQILLLDTGLEPLDDEMIMDFFELTQVPIEVLPVPLDHFKRVVQKLLADPE